MVKCECDICHGHNNVRPIYDGAKLLSNQKEILLYICEECMDKISTKYTAYKGNRNNKHYGWKLERMKNNND